MDITIDEARAILASEARPEFKKYIETKLAGDFAVEIVKLIDAQSAGKFGDGWYDGFLKAKQMQESGKEHLEDVDTDHIMYMSEHAESEHNKLTRDNSATK